MSHDKMAIATILSVILVMISTLVNPDSEPSLEDQVKEYQYRLNKSFDMVSKILYIQDSRTGICYATANVSGWHGHLATVDCDRVPAGILNITE